MEVIIIMNCCHDFEDNFRYHYIDEKLRECFDKIVDVEEAIMGAEIELEIATKLNDLEGIKEINEDIDKLKEILHQLEEREEILEDMFEIEIIKEL